MDCAPDPLFLIKQQHTNRNGDMQQTRDARRNQAHTLGAQREINKYIYIYLYLLYVYLYVCTLPTDTDTIRNTDGYISDTTGYVLPKHTQTDTIGYKRTQTDTFLDAIGYTRIQPDTSDGYQQIHTDIRYTWIYIYIYTCAVYFSFPLPAVSERLSAASSSF